MPQRLDRRRANDLLKKLALPARIFPELVAPGTDLGALRPGLTARLGLPDMKVIAPPAHDTASAVAGVPTANTGKPNWAYISSGTWSLMGVEVRQAVLSARAQQINVTNEGGIDGTYRLLKNIMGLWLVQQCNRSFEAQGKKFDYAELAGLAAKAAPLRSVVNPDDPRFLNPPDMPKAIQAYCRETRQPVPSTPGQLVRCAYESLALKYRQVLGWLEELTGNRIEVIHIVGGGSRSELLNQFTADACQRPVVTGPVEATALATSWSRFAPAVNWTPCPSCVKSSAGQAKSKLTSPGRPPPGMRRWDKPNGPELTAASGSGSSRSSPLRSGHPAKAIRGRRIRAHRPRRRSYRIFTNPLPTGDNSARHLSQPWAMYMDMAEPRNSLDSPAPRRGAFLRANRRIRG